MSNIIFMIISFVSRLSIFHNNQQSTINRRLFRQLWSGTAGWLVTNLATSVLTTTVFKPPSQIWNCEHHHHYFIRGSRKLFSSYYYHYHPSQTWKDKLNKISTCSKNWHKSWIKYAIQMASLHLGILLIPSLTWHIIHDVITLMIKAQLISLFLFAAFPDIEVSMTGKYNVVSWYSITWPILKLCFLTILWTESRIAGSSIVKIPRLNHLRSDTCNYNLHCIIGLANICCHTDKLFWKHRKRLRPRVPRGSSMSLGDCHKIKPIRFSQP